MADVIVLLSTRPQWESVSAAIFSCNDPKDARKKLEEVGIVTMEPEGLRQLITPDKVAAAIEFTKLNGQAIFQQVRKDKDGKFERDDDDQGRLVMDIGKGGQRWQAHLSKPKRQAMKGAGEGEEGEEGDGEEEGDEGEDEEGGGAGEMVSSHKRSMAAFEKLLPLKLFGAKVLVPIKRGNEVVQKAVMLVNHPGQDGDPPVGEQCFHIDLESNRKGLVSIVPLEPVSLLVSPNSHKAVSSYTAMREAGDKKLTEAQVMRFITAARPVRVEMEPGQVILLHGNTVHAGDAGRPGKWSPRLHYYLTAGAIDNETTPVEGIGRRFAALFR
jgi:hypothetical protein